MTGAVRPVYEHEQSALVQLSVETARRAAKRLVKPEPVHVCPACHIPLFPSLRPFPREAVAL
jgi:hypothetical protein